MPAATSIKTKSANALGAPAQHGQSSRKGKRAWRKNVDIDDLEESLEELRTEERVTGSYLHKKNNDELFTVDLKGDERVRKSLPKFDMSQLTSAKILAQRSAVAAVFSRPSTKKAGPSISREEKARLLRIGKRHVRGPLNSVVDPTEMGSGSALLEPSEAVKKSGKYDVWGIDEESVKGVSVTEETRDFLLPFVTKPKVKAPPTKNLRSEIDLPAVLEPHQGTSYNPPVSSHQELLRTAHEIEERRLKEAEKFIGVKETMDAARKTTAESIQPGLALGMALDGNNEAEEEDEHGPLEREPAKPTVRKTKQQRAKAAKQLAERKALEERTARKRFLSSISSARAVRSSLRRKALERHAAEAARRFALRVKIKNGLVGQRLGKHKVKEAEVDVQLGEDLSESLRALKPEGNLFRDRFLSLQHRALIEPRVPVLPKKRRSKIKEYEKHAWKRFE